MRQSSKVVTQILTEKVKEFIISNEKADVNEILLKSKTIHGIPASIIADQIIGRKKAKDKLPSFYKNLDIIYPPGLNLEQSSSERTARYKAKLVQSIAGSEKLNKGLDLTGGFGIDATFMSDCFSNYDIVEPTKELLDIVRHNHQILGIHNTNYHLTTAEQFLRDAKSEYDLIFIDPSRRNDKKQKVFSLTDCEPDVVSLTAEVFNHSGRFLIKAAPLLDIQKGCSELNSVKKVIIQAVDNEVKEVLFMCVKGYVGAPEISAVNLSDQTESVFTFDIDQEKQAESFFSKPLSFIYEPNASIMKAGAFKLVGSRFHVNKLHIHTHLYTSHELIDSFPGRIFKIEAIVKPEMKTLRVYLPEGKANVVTRNYPLSAEELKKKTGLKDGGEKYLLGFTDIEQKTVVVAKRIK